jgi:hypothetical protein
MMMNEQCKTSQLIQLSQVFDWLKQQQEQEQQEEDDKSSMAVKPKSEMSIMSGATKSIISMESTTKDSATTEDNGHKCRASEGQGATKVEKDKDEDNDHDNNSGSSESKSTPIESPPITPTRLQWFACHGYKVKESPVPAPEGIPELAVVEMNDNPRNQYGEELGDLSALSLPRLAGFACQFWKPKMTKLVQKNRQSQWQR